MRGPIPAFLLVTAAAAVLAGCAHPNLAGLEGNALDTSYGLRDRREAKQHIRVATAVPAGAEVMGDFSTQRCHQYATNQPPSEATLRDDLVLLAYAEGADGLTDVRIAQQSGLLQNCWYVVRATATFFRLPK